MGGTKGKSRKEQVLYQEKAAALNLDLSCSYLKEHACNKWFGRRVCPSEAKSWGYLPSFSMLAALIIQIHTCPRVSPAWASVLPHVQGSAAARANPGNGTSTLFYGAVWGGYLLVCVASGQGAAGETDPLPVGFPRGARHCDQESRGGTQETRHFARSWVLVMII